MSSRIKIAVLMTCHNRENLTSSCLKNLLIAKTVYNNTGNQDELLLHLVLVDDGCTDSTVEKVRQVWGEERIEIIEEDGNRFWAGGMYTAWTRALALKESFDYYLLLNDDTDVFPNCFDELFKTEDFCISRYGRKGIYSGATSSKVDKSKSTYGGAIYHSKLWGHPKAVFANGEPQLIDITNANILLAPAEVVESIGIFYKGFIHSASDSDYAMKARRKGIPVLLSGNTCGCCDNDHVYADELKKKILSMSIKQRKAFFNHPLHSKKDYMTFLRRNLPLKLPMAWLFWKMNIYTPSLYYRINGLR